MKEVGNSEELSGLSNEDSGGNDDGDNGDGDSDSDNDSDVD